MPNWLAARRLASAFERAGEGLEDDARLIGAKIRASGWDGPDALRRARVWQATGMVNDHLTCCHRHESVKGLARG